MKTILAVDSTSDILSISLSKGLNILAQLKDDKSIKHMVNIIDDIDHVLKKANKTIKEIELFALNLGPGDFTGGRIGISVVKMFSMLSGNPVYGFNSLDVFAVGAMLKNIASIPIKISDQTRFYVIPLMDVRNDEIYSGIYEVSRSIRENKVVFSFDFEDKKYFLNKIFDSFLMKSKDLNKKTFQLINQINLLNRCNCSSCSNIFKEDNFHKENDIKKIQNSAKSLEYKKSCFILTANAIKTYAGLFENLKDEISLNCKETEIILDDKNTNPSSISINFLADYSDSFLMRSLPITPVYVRDFIAFSKK